MKMLNEPKKKYRLLTHIHLERTNERMGGEKNLHLNQFVMNIFIKELH